VSFLATCANSVKVESVCGLRYCSRTRKIAPEITLLRPTYFAYNILARHAAQPTVCWLQYVLHGGRKNSSKKVWEFYQKISHNSGCI